MPSADADRSNARDIARAVAILRSGGLVAFPTETVYGLGARALDPAALARLFEAKGRPATHPLIAHVLGATEARALTTAWSAVAARLAASFWPGPLTLVVPRAAHVPLALTGGGASVGLRAPAHALARALLEALGEPIAAPSANRYQTLSPTTAAHVRASLGPLVELILDGGPCASGIESTVVDLCNGPPRILRPGALDFPTLAGVEPGIVDFMPASLGALGALDHGVAHPSPGLDRRHYAPRTPLVVASGRESAIAEARRRSLHGERVGLVLVLPLDEPVPDAVVVRALGQDARAYARDLFASLHLLDDAGLTAILVEPVPDTPPWRAVADRLCRGSELA